MHHVSRVDVQVSRYRTRHLIGRALLLALVALFAGLVLWHPARVAVQTLLLLPALFPSAPIDPLSLVTAAPTATSRRLPVRGRHGRGELFGPPAAADTAR